MMTDSDAVKTVTEGKIIIEGVANYIEDWWYWGSVGGAELYDLLDELFILEGMGWAGTKHVRLTLEVIDPPKGETHE